MSDSATDETPEGTLAVILNQGVRAIRIRVDELTDRGEDFSEYVALISSGGDTPEVRVFNIRMILREGYAAHVQNDFPEIAEQVRAPLESGHFRIVVLFDGRIAVRTLAVADEGPVLTFPINARGGLA